MFAFTVTSNLLSTKLGGSARSVLSESYFNSLFNATFGSPTLPPNCNLACSYDSSVDGDFVIYSGGYVDYNDFKSIKITYQTYDDNDDIVQSPFTLKVDPQRRPDSIRFDSAVPEALIVGETVDINFTIMDNRGQPWGSNTGEYGLLDVTMGTTDTKYVDSTGAATIYTDGTGTITIYGVDDSTGNKNPKVALNFALFDGSTECASTTFTPPTVIVYPQLGGAYPIKLNISPKEVNSGQTLTLTFTAYEDDVTQHKTYTHLYKDVQITQHGGMLPDAVVTRDINFVNGVAKVEIEAKNAADDLLIYTEIDAAGYGSTIYVEAAEKIKVNPGAPAEFAVTSTYDSAYDNDTFTIACVDKNGNVVTSYDQKDTKFYISAVNKIGAKISDINTKFASGVDSEGRVMLTFINGVATLYTDDYCAFAVDDVITFATGDKSLTGSVIEAH